MVKRILFVCVENANRSQMAEAFARIHGGAAVEVYSAGSQPSGQINTRAVDSMREIDYDLMGHASTGLNDIPNIEYDCVTTMGCGDACPHVKAKRREDWQIPDPRNMPPAEFRQVRQLIEGKVKELLQSL